MNNGVTEDNKCMTESFNGEAMETERSGAVRVNGEEKMCAVELKYELREEESEIPAENVDERGLQVRKVAQVVASGEIEEIKFLKKLNDEFENEYKSIKINLEVFELNLQHKQKLQRDALYEEKRSTIKRLVTFRMNNVLFIDTRCSKTKPEYVDTVLYKLDKKVQIRHQWRRHTRYPSLWEGAVAAFEDPKNARMVRRQLKNSKHLKVVSILQALSVLIEAEIRYPDSNETATVLVLRAKKPLPRKMEQLVSAQCRLFGQVIKIEFQPNIKPGEICRVSYRYASHAIYVKLITEQTIFLNLGRASAEVIMTRKESRIMEYMRNHLRHK